MQKIYNYGNATVYVINPNDIDQNNLKKATENFLRKVMEEINNGNTDTSGDIREKQILDK